MLAGPAATTNHRPGPARSWTTWAALALILAVAWTRLTLSPVSGGQSRLVYVEQ